MNLSLPHFIHFILLFLFVFLLLLIMSIIKNDLGNELCKTRIKSSKTETIVFSTAVLFSSLDELGIKLDTDTIKTEIPFEKKMKDIKFQCKEI